MLRYILWLIIIYFAYRVIKTLLTISQRAKNKESDIQGFSHIEEADFEDITPKNDNSEISAPEKNP
jgi:hypothetical protein